MSEFYSQIFCDRDGTYSTVIEDDGNVAYAYLLKERDIIADVWLYNVQGSPEEMPWLAGEDAPYRNPKRFVRADLAISPITSNNDVAVEWTFDKSELRSVYILIRGEKIGMMTPGSKPGWSKLALVDGPLANVMK